MSNKRKVKFKDLIKGDKPVLVDFYATWCGPCKQLSPIVNSVKNDLGDKMKVIKIDVDKKQSVSNKYKIKSLPTLAIFQNGKIVWRESGLKTKTQLLKIANHYIDNASESTGEETQETENKGSWFGRLFK
jgi:thioredoxin 1